MFKLFFMIIGFMIGIRLGRWLGDAVNRIVERGYKDQFTGIKTPSCDIHKWERDSTGNDLLCSKCGTKSKELL